MQAIAEISVKDKTMQLVQGDITLREVDAIVNAANCYLQHGGGVAAAIVKRGGQIIQDESNKIGYVPVGEAVITTAGALPAKFVIHTVGPKMGEGDEDRKLTKAINSVLALASSKGFSSISIPAISAGIYGFPKDRCAKILVQETYNYLLANPNTTLKLVEFCIFDAEALEYFKFEYERLKKP